MALRETRRILLDGNIVDVVRHGDELVAGDGRSLGVDEAVHLPPVVPSKIVCVHLNYTSRVEEMMVKLPPAPTYFHKPVSALNAHKAAVVPTERMQVAELRGGDRHRHRTHGEERLP